MPQAAERSIWRFGGKDRLIESSKAGTQPPNPKGQLSSEALDRLYAEDFTAVDSQGIRTKADLLAGLATDPEIVEGTYELSAVRQWGDLAVAKGRGRMVIRSSDGTTRELEYESFNVFEQQDGRWVYAAAFLP